MSSPSANTNGKHQSSSPTNQIPDKSAYPPALKHYLEEDYDRYKDFLVNGHNTTTERGQAVRQSLRSWDEIWDRAKTDTRDNQAKPKI